MIPKNWWNIENATDEQRWKAIGLFLRDTYQILNHGWTFQDNARGTIIEVTFKVANVEERVRHGLEYVPQNYIVVGASVALIVYDGLTASDRTFFYLRSSQAGTARIFLF
jgi:hypothetical protein